ncbi:MAG: isochorismatase family protein [Planctomycetota bacterium]|nr:MAG: isochorismatase family protein [Planctomycetota bacterium]
MRPSSVGLFDVDTREPCTAGTTLTFRRQVASIRTKLSRIFSFHYATGGLMVATTCLNAASARNVRVACTRFVCIGEGHIDWPNELRQHRQFILEKQHLGSPECNRCCRAYDVFQWNPNARALVLAAGVDTWCVFGISLEYCVRATVRGLLTLGQRVVVLSDAVISSRLAGGTLEQGLALLAADGARIERTEWLLRDHAH